MTQTEKLLMCLAEFNCTVGRTEEGAILITPAKEEARGSRDYCEGDFMYCEAEVGLVTYKNICIVDKIEGGTLYVKCNLRSVLGNHHNMIDEDLRVCTLYKDAGILVNADSFTARLVKEEEKQLLINALYQERKIWNPETLQIEDDRAPRVGDKCVFWDEDNQDVIVATLHTLFECGEKYCTENFGAFECCVLLQDFDFDTMRPKHE